MRQKSGAMNKILLTFLAALVLVIDLGIGCTAKPVPPLHRHDLIGAWQGYEDDHQAFMRLELKQSGTGLLAINYWPAWHGKRDPVRCYRVRWVQKQQGGHLLILHLRPISRATEPLTVLSAEGYFLETTESNLTLKLRQGLWDWDGTFNLARADLYEGRAKAEVDALRHLRLKTR